MLKNTPEQIVTRHRGAKFYCAECRKTYQQCKCRVYVSVDTLRPQIRHTKAQEGAS